MPAATGDLIPGETLTIGGLTIEPLHTPGHTAGMVSLLVNGSDVFTGDTLFKGSVGGVRAPGHTTYADLKSSVMDTLLTLPPQTRIHPGHTDPTTVDAELADEPLRADLEWARPGGHRGVHGTREAGHADLARRPTTTAATRRGSAGPTAATTSCLDRRSSSRPAPGRCPAPLVSLPDRSGLAMADDDKIPQVEGPADGKDRRTRGRAGAAPGGHDREQRRAVQGRARGRARAPPHRGGRADRDRAGHDEGRRDEGRAGAVLPGHRPGPARAPRRVPAQARAPARRRPDRDLQGDAQGDRAGARRAARSRRSRSSTTSRSRPPRSGRSTGRGCTTAGTWRSRCSTRGSPRPCAPTCRTSG